MRLAAALTLIVATTAIASAQGSPAADACVYDAAAPRAAITGKIVDPSGAPLVGARLTLAPAFVGRFASNLFFDRVQPLDLRQRLFGER